MEKLLGNIDQTLHDLISLQKQINRDDRTSECLAQLRVIDPQAHMAQMEEVKDKLLYDVYKWILDTPEYVAFTNWIDPNLVQSRLLWIKGEAGTGKTMLLMGIIRELSGQSATLAPSLAYFFCQGTGNTALHNAIGVLRSLIWMLLVQQPHLASHLLRRYPGVQSSQFADSTEFYVLRGVFEGMIKDPGLSSVYLAVDALDECDKTEPGLMQLL